MKFAREFQEALKGDFPPHWVDSAVPYGPLKKIIKKVRRELEEIGLNPAELADGVALQYEFDDGDVDEVFKPKLTLYYEGGEAVDATLSTDTRHHFEALVAQRKKNNGIFCDTTLNERREPRSPDGSDDAHAGLSIPKGPSSLSHSDTCRVEVITLSCDAEFFRLLQKDVTSLDALQAREQKAMTEQITALSKDMTHLTSPSRLTKTDMYRWRELFDIYLQAQVFFSTREQDHGSRNSATAARQLGWFQSEVTKRGLLESFKLPSSFQAFGRFVAINITLLQNLKFQEINQKAIGKILKSKSIHPERSLSSGYSVAKNTFPKLIESDAIMSDTMAKAVVKQANEDNIDEELIKKLKKYFPKETREKRIQLETEDGIATFGVTYKHPSEDKCKVM
ncbi:putative RING finger [Hyphodiscus hymeniophilus]|uniref:RING finger n=1 Tax=Hyphodiscus hymeniophilus TaxID=353542 RepID=A0A9P6VG44_9HELO|nr:putative RING finger [Hyphodiscus hymeniophilus]